MLSEVEVGYLSQEVTNLCGSVKRGFTGGESDRVNSFLWCSSPSYPRPLTPGT